ncbi:MAG TPA: helix-turn-helix domain-containing protein [Solirubrobacteraceae bacterium]|nr:helix-turn-helix domain-containing protein [Solirubrobacteraceae bacterium]
MHRVVALALPGTVLLDLAAPAHVFGALGGRRYELVLASVDAGPVGTTSGFPVQAVAGIGALEQADTVVVPGYEGIDQPPPAAAIDALRAAHARGARVMSICTGAFALAHAGLLDGRRATTHWRAAALLAERFPRVDVDPGVLYVDAGDVLTSAGVAAGLDLCLHVLRRDHGAEAAARAARRMVLAPHRDGGQAQFIERPLAAPGGGGLEPTRAWALGRLHEPLDVAGMARHACVSPRTFARRFRAETGTTPLQWLLRERVRAAQRLLETTAEPVEAIAQRCGFGTAASLRAHFARATATTPTAYRRGFRAAA